MHSPRLSGPRLSTPAFAHTLPTAVKRGPRSDRPLVEALPDLLEERGLSLRSLARKAQVNASHLSRVLRGADAKRATPHLARRIARALELPDDYFPEVREASVVQRIQADPAWRDKLYDAPDD
jgi:transcriptional regulator with XRE-family HTH domain